MEKVFGELFQKAIILNEEEKSYREELCLISIKSLLPSETTLGNIINYERYIKEIKLWTYYRKNYNLSTKNIRQLDQEVYFKSYDDSIFLRTLPILVANTDQELIVHEILKNILFTSASVGSIFTGLALNLLFKYELEGLDSIEKVKEVIINFSQEDFLGEYLKYFRQRDISKRYKIDFELARIDLLDALNGKESKSFQEIYDFRAVKDGQEAKTYIGRLLNSLDHDLSGPSHKISSFSSYLIDLRKSRINPESLKIDKYEEPDIFALEPGEEFFHSLLNKAKVKDKIFDGEEVRLIVSCRSGEYEFRK